MKITCIENPRGSKAYISRDDKTGAVCDLNGRPTLVNERDWNAYLRTAAKLGFKVSQIGGDE